jgi:hypothetical protein
MSSGIFYTHFLCVLTLIFIIFLHSDFFLDEND